MAKRILRPREVQEKLGIGQTKFWADVKSGRLPPLRRLGPNSVGHLEDEIDALIDSAPRAIAKRILRRSPASAA
jgi:predicted DNA-binding transcriptional regulator AlpA